MGVNGVGSFERRLSGIPGQNTAAPGTGGNDAGFMTLLQERSKVGLNFSKHAAKRMNERGIAVDNQLMSNISHLSSTFSSGNIAVSSSFSSSSILSSTDWLGVE